MDACHFLFRRFSLLALVFSAAFALFTAPAYAAEPSPEILGKVTKLNKKALDAFQKQDFDGARDFLKQALDICNGAHLEHHPITARTEIHIGVLLIAGLKQHDAGIKHFQKALQIQPDIQITKSLVTPELQDAFEEAVLGAGGSPTAGGGGGDDNGEGGGGAHRASGGDDDQGGGAGADNGGGDDDRPRKKVVKKKAPKKKRGDDEEGDDDGKKTGDDDDDSTGGGYKPGTVFVGVAIGTGAGIASGSGDESAAHKLGGAGFAAAQLVQISPEVGYFLKTDFLLSLQIRYQYISGVNPGPMTTNAQTSAIAAFARGTWFGGHESFHPYFSLAVGGGYIRHALVFTNDTKCGPASNMTCVDTIKGGPFLVGPGAGFMIDLGSTMSLVLGINSQLGVPNFTLNFDGNVGLAARF